VHFNAIVVSMHFLNRIQVLKVLKSKLNFGRIKFLIAQFWLSKKHKLTMLIRIGHYSGVWYLIIY